MEALLQNQNLISPFDDTISLENAFDGVEAIGLYFSAHWCGPCRGFTPKLTEFYNDINAERKRFEIVFMSSDSDKASFDSYRKEMPWLALPVFEGDNSSLKEKLSAKFKVRGIPTLVILSPNGELITDQGRAGVQGAPQDFPWMPKTFWEIMSGDIVDNSGSTYNAEEYLKTKEAIGIYFSAHWCGPCQNFTPKLVETYNAIKESGKEFEIVFASSDRGNEKFQEYFGIMPWKAIPFGDKRKEELSSLYNVEGIPTLVIVNPQTGKIINDEGVGRVSGDPTGEEFPWHPKPLYNIDEAPGAVLNEKATFIAFNKSFEPEFISALDSIATAKVAEYEAAGEEQKLYFVYADESHQMYQRLVGFLNLNTSAPQYIILNLGQQVKAVQQNVELSGETASAFIEAFNADALEFVHFRS
eukprot:TRINITY_DN320_c0_g1_i1.p1 TRINITY_DN320_c0_g1~~TRINITY_DN320_c0_g1_i1.p1  ORF type:complete len:425 (+),score=113.39 TRINITY_DN320_c0_g1_i1:35-1276(+)